VKREFEGNSYTAGRYHQIIPFAIPTISDREMVFRAVNFKESNYEFATCGYSVEDDRQRVVKDRVSCECDRAQAWDSRAKGFTGGGRLSDARERGGSGG
jgi:hypothetical protein